MKNLLLIVLFLLFGSKNIYSQQVVINEVVSSNGSLIADEDNSYQDWIELYNNSASPINLNGYGLTDDATLLFKWVFPNVTINPGSYLLVWASDKNRINPANPLHTNFKISAAGETITLTNPLSVIVDTAPATSLLINESVGRIPNGTGSFVVIQTPTPNAENANGIPIITLNPPSFSQNSGFLTSSFNLSLTSNDPGVTILYTLDGSDPDENNLSGTTYSYKNQYPEIPGQAFGTFLNQSFQTLQYSAPINIVDRSSQPNKIANISSTYDFSPPYFPNNPIFKGTVVRAKAIKAGAISSQVITKTYFIAPTGNSTFSLPVVAISTSENRLFDYNDGIYVAGKDFDQWRTDNPTDIADYEIGNFARKGGSSERVANFSYFVNGNEVLNQDIGIRIRGNYSRIYPSKSFNLYSRTELGAENFNFPVFSDKPYQNYVRMSLKNSSGDFYHTMFRDPLNHELIKGMNVETEAYQPTITFLNGEYWGILSLREKYDDKYFKQVYNIESNELDVLENNAEEEEGDNIHYLQMIDYVENNSLATTVNYDYIKTQMDVENFEDYFISNIYLQNVDWPGNNVIYWRKKTAQYEPNAPYGHDGRWRWAIHDMDSSFGISSGSISLNSLADATAVNGPEWPNPEWSTLLLRKLLENNSFKNDFISRFADLMNSYFKSERVVAKINEMKTVLQPEMPKQFNRWKAPLDFGDWNYFLNEEIAFAQQRPGFQREHIRNQFTIANNINTTIAVSNQQHGFVKINTIDIKSTTPGIAPNPYPWTGIYFADIPIKLKAEPLPGYIFSHWTGFSTSTDDEITVTSNQSFSITAVFIQDGFVQETEQPIYFWLFNGAIPNDTPITSINSTFEIPTEAVLQYQSCLAGYPFTSADPNWRKASMERKNSPTAVNYIPEANNNVPFTSSGMKGIQIKQPFQNNGLENTLQFNFSTANYKNIKFGFAAKNDGAADGLLMDYSISTGAPTWITTGLTPNSLPLTASFDLFEIDFSSIENASNNPNFKIRIRFSGANMTADNGEEVQFNNFSLKGTQIPLLYPTPNVLTINQPITNLIPTLSAAATSFGIVPSLPSGLSFDTATGIISGTPTQLSVATDYEVTASNSGGSTTFTLSIAVNDVAPNAFSYATPNVFTINEDITSLSPTITGENLTFVINPSLPNGLSFDTATGVISGTPTVLQSTTDYEVTASNSGGSTTFTLSIAVNDVAPNALSYATPNVFTINEAITSLSPTIIGENLTFAISPNLPNGLSFDTVTGIISGTPSALQSATDYEVTTTNSGGSITFTLTIAVNDVLPSALSYQTPNVFTVNETITSLSPTIIGENLTFAISPNLPNGLSFDTATGVISGTSTVLQSATDYEVIASNSGGSITFTLSIAVNDVAPASLSYPTPNVFTINNAIADLSPTTTGENLTFAISPALPNGLIFNSVTGIISGTPTVLSAATNYTVTATNSGGSTTFVISIAIIDVAPASLSYPTPNVFTINNTIANLSPTTTGENLTFAISPALPNGLSFDTVTGIISGTPSALQSATDYEVTATNSGGSITFTLTIAVNDVLPSALSYQTPNVFTVNETITSLSPTITGENLTFAISPSLPNGLSFDTATGVISGTPTVIQSATDYEVNASNSGGSITFTLSIAVNNVAPSALGYQTPNVFTINEAITSLSPSIIGENLTFVINPSLPNGLSFDTATGVISGTSTVLQSATDYEVAATNSGGNTTFTLSISIIDATPNGLSYSTPNVFTINSVITDLEPAITGENLTFAINPSLPNGLSFDTATAIISGTPTVLSAATNYTVTATNSGGTTTFVLSISIIDATPNDLSYSTPNVFTINSVITDLEPAITGENLTFAINPSLPNGLSFDTVTGIISGTPTVLSASTNYTVTATNSGGSTTFVISIAVIDVAPASLSYPTPNVFTINNAIANLSPAITGENLTFAINPSLPNGLSFDTANGIISGTPTVLQSTTDYEVTATNSGGNTTFTLSISIIDATPSGLSYSTPNVFTINSVITDLESAITGENLTFAINPSLPNGLSFDTATGIISGTPSALQSATDYEVTATNSGGSTTFILSISVIDVAPSALSYSTPNVFTINEAITSLSPTIIDENLTFAINPSLPNGLIFDTATGIISGTPTVLQSATDYEVNASNSGGSTTFTLSIAVNDFAPNVLSYSTPNVFTINQAITSLSPTTTGENLTFSISPSLPNGLMLNTTTGIISGTPTGLQSATDYTVTATNSGGSTSFVSSIAVIDVAPSALSYSTPNVFTINQTITSLSPTTTGENLTFAISPALPNGLIFNSATGIISGTPTVLSAATNYTVTATNSGGNTMFMLSIAVNNVGPTNLSYNTPNEFIVSQEISNLMPTFTGENVLFNIAPSLPIGLSFGTITGMISGTPTALQMATDYTITATNSGGSTTFVVSIAVIDMSPSILSYPTPNVFTINNAITNLLPTITENNLTFAIVPSLPNGLSFDTATGIISGMPSALQSAADYEVTATNSGGSTTFTLSIAVIDIVPSGLSYATPNVFTINQTITNLSPTVIGENLTFGISPILPTGLSFNSATGIISGTPTMLQSATNYTVAVTNSGGSNTFTLSIEIIDIVPSGLSYPTPNVFTINQNITSLLPTTTGDNVTFAISPILPTGLLFNSSTGVISGIPTQLSGATNYTVTETNSGGSTSFVLSIAVIDFAPSALSYSTPNVFTLNQVITNLVPTVTGENMLFSILPSLPNGLTFNTTTGIVSGTPLALQTATNYTVTATNSGGSTSFVLSIAVIDVTPSSLSYNTPNVFTINQAITSLSPTTTGENLTFSISPSLPNGLMLNTTTGIISGTPTALQSATDYTVTATNSGGSTSFVSSIAVIDFVPSALSYSTPNVFTINQTIASLSPTTTGENLTFSISPSLPTGLSFDTITGIISGTPTALQSPSDYVVIATNSGGSTSFVLSIAVIGVTPSALSYSTPNVFTINQTITSLSPITTGENLTFSISPSLPNGLIFNSATGVISGTPTALQSATDYNVTATNSGGSVSFVVSIAVIDVAPNTLSYSTPNVFTINQAITSLSPTTTGENLTFSISPSLPNGLMLNTTTGIISGTPTALQSATDYTVTATNSGGSTSFVLSIAVIDVTPNALSYNTPNVFTINQTITSLSPTTTGENLTFSISPSLPNGLTFNSATGVISGTPTALQSATDYNVTATNSGGSVSFVVSIAVEEELGIDEPIKNSFNVYPNPFMDEINIIHNFNEVNYVIYSLDGKEIQRGVLQNSKIMVNQLPSSVYLLKLTSEKAYQIIRIAKK